MALFMQLVSQLPILYICRSSLQSKMFKLPCYVAPIYLFFQLRVYPQGFADKINSLLPKLMIGCEGKPNIDDMPQSGPDVFESLPWSTWEEAHLIPCIRYLRGNVSLDVPAEWMAVFPKPFEILHKMECRAKGDHEEKIHTT